ncbi:MAG: putative metal-binding motif-containing protein [Myxococcota bacterium]
MRFLLTVPALLLLGCAPSSGIITPSTGGIVVDDGDDDGGDDVNDPDGETDEPPPLDVDGDGFTQDVDCDDTDPTIFPGADERCNERDDDCDGEADEDAIDAFTWFADEDGDSFGSLGSEQTGCDPTAGSVAQGGDCDDADPLVYPGQVELCDSIDNDCTAETTEDGLVSWFRGDRGGIDLTAEFTSGSIDAPYLFQPERSGELRLCGVSAFVRMVLDVSVDIVGVGGAEENVLDASEADNAIVVTNADRVSVTGIMLRDGFADAVENGGGIYCEDVNEIVLDDVVITQAFGELGGGVFIDNCEMTAVNTIIKRNRATIGGGLYVQSGAATFENSRIWGNDASSVGGGIAVRAAGAVDIDLIDTTVDLNETQSFGAALYAFSYLSTARVDIRCASVDGRAGFLGNEANTTNGFENAIYMYASRNNPLSYTSDACDYGVERSDEDNLTSSDLYWQLAGDVDRYTLDNGESFTCDEDNGCRFRGG